MIGHEITHGFDPQGAQVDAEGNLDDWWAAADRVRFRSLSGRLAAQYEAIEVRPGLSVDGWLTASENIADLGGIQVAHDALRRHLATTGGPLPPPPFTPAGDAASGVAPYQQEQRFFVTAASVWRVESRDESLATAIKTNGHAPGPVRGIQPLRKMEAV